MTLSRNKREGHYIGHCQGVVRSHATKKVTARAASFKLSQFLKYKKAAPGYLDVLYRLLNYKPLERKHRG